MPTRAEAMALYRAYLRMRHQFPNKKGRSVMRRWTTFYFRAREAEYARLVQIRGPMLAEAEAQVWCNEARRDLGAWSHLRAFECYLLKSCESGRMLTRSMGKRLRYVAANRQR